MRYVPEHEAEQMYDDMLDECFPVKIGTLEYRGSYALKELDPIAYNCGFSDYCDAEGITTDEDEADEDTDTEGDSDE